MAEKEPEFVVTDRRKYRMDGDTVTENPEHQPAPVEARPEAVTAAAPDTPPPSAVPQSAAVTPEDSGQQSSAEAQPASEEDTQAGKMPPPPTAEETAASVRAYQQTTERLDDIARANDLSGKREPAMTFERVVQSFYSSALLQLGLIGVPGQQQVRVDLMGARQTVDMLGVLAEKTKGNLTADEQRLLDTVLFELRMAFLETMQYLAQQAQAQQGAAASSTPGVTPFTSPAKPKR